MNFWLRHRDLGSRVRIADGNGREVILCVGAVCGDLMDGWRLRIIGCIRASAEDRIIIVVGHLRVRAF